MNIGNYFFIINVDYVYKLVFSFYYLFFLEKNINGDVDCFGIFDFFYKISKWILLLVFILFFILVLILNFLNIFIIICLDVSNRFVKKIYVNIN